VLAALTAAAAGIVAGCSFNLSDLGLGSREPAQPAQPATTVGSGEVRAALILPLSASGNAGLAAQSMKNAAEMALADFNPTNVQLLIKDDAGTNQGAYTAAQQALDEGAEIIIGPPFAHSVGQVGQLARARGIPRRAASTC
jgi:ABC-type branched-subunit amino acid transport system substrate-binding protein